MVRIYCLSSIDKIKIESPETLVNDNVEDYYSTAQWDNDGISTAEKIRQNFQILESFQLTEISIGYDFINETDEKVYLMFIFRQDIGLLVIKMVPGAVKFHSLSNKSFNLFISTSMLFNNEMDFDLLIHVRCIKNTKTRGVIGEEEKEYYERYANKIEAFCNGDKSLFETVFEIFSFNLPNQTRENVLRQKLSDISKLIKLLCDLKTGNITNIQEDQRYNQKIKCLLMKNYRNNGVVRSELRHGDDDPEKSQLICKLEKNETKVVTHVLERKNSIENHQHKIQKAFTKDNNIMLESADNKMTTKIDVAQSACLNPSRSLINSVPINVESCASYNNNIDLSFNQPNQLSYNIPSILNFQQPSNLQLNSFCNIQNMIPFLSQPPNLHTINPAINGFNQIQLNPSHFTQSSLFNYNNNQPINTELHHFLPSSICDNSIINSQDYIKYLLLQNIFNQSNTNLSNNYFTSQNLLKSFLEPISAEIQAIQANKNPCNFFYQSFLQNHQNHPHDVVLKSSNCSQQLPLQIDNVLDINGDIQSTTDMPLPNIHSNIIDNIVSPQFINEMTDNPDKSVKQSCDNISCESSSTSNKNSNNPSISAPQIFNFSDTNLSQAVCHQHNSPIIVENKNNKEHPSNSTKTFSISTLNTKRGRPKIYQNDKNRKEARLKSSKKYNEKRSLQSVTIKAELDAAITVLEMENETLKNKMEAVKNTAKEFLKLHKTLILEMDKNSLKLIT